MLAYFPEKGFPQPSLYHQSNSVWLGSLRVVFFQIAVDMLLSNVCIIIFIIIIFIIILFIIFFYRIDGSSFLT